MNGGCWHETPADPLHNTTTTNCTDDEFDDHYIFDNVQVRVAFILAYTFVFGCCFVGNLLVIVVVVLHRRMRSLTNFFLVNLAVADLCVGIFCIYQNLSQYLIATWVFGDFLCKMYHFVHTLSYTASIVILMVIAFERHLAIIHPMRSKQIMTLGKLRGIIVVVWVLSAAYASPRLFMYGTHTYGTGGTLNATETICILRRALYDSQIYDCVNFTVVFLLPLGVISAIYTRIGMELWTSSPNYHPEQMEMTPLGGKKKATPSSRVSNGVHLRMSESGLQARKKVIRMLVIVVLSFALCNLPYHARKLWQYWSPSYEGASDMAVLLTPITFAVMYLNCAINPLLYAFLSDNFRKGMKDVLMCRFRKRHFRHRSTLRTQVTSSS